MRTRLLAHFSERRPWGCGRWRTPPLISSSLQSPLKRRHLTTTGWVELESKINLEVFHEVQYWDGSTLQPGWVKLSSYTPDHVEQHSVFMFFLRALPPPGFIRTKQPSSQTNLPETCFEKSAIKRNCLDKSAIKRSDFLKRLSAIKRFVYLNYSDFVLKSQILRDPSF